MLESWQADAAGLFAGQPGADPKVNGFCRFAADGESGEFTLKTVKPGLVRHKVGYQAPHIAALDRRARHQHRAADPHLF